MIYSRDLPVFILINHIEAPFLSLFFIDLHKTMSLNYAVKDEHEIGAKFIY
jgi:hypothetical protein